jgi:hypothetical protein
MTIGAVAIRREEQVPHWRDGTVAADQQFGGNFSRPLVDVGDSQAASLMKRIG